MSVYVQWMTDRILWSYCDYVRAYVNDIVIYSVILTEHIQHFQTVFDKLVIKRICLFSEKFFLNYLFIHLLKQQINTLKFVTVEIKLTVIINLEFLCILTQLKKYLDLISYLCQYISHYVMIIKFLQLCKTLLNQLLHDIYKKIITEQND